MTNKEVIEALYAAFAAGDIPAVTGLMAEDIEWNEAEGNKLADRSPYISPQAVVDGVFQRLADDFEQFEVDINTIISEGDLVVTEGRCHATARDTGVKINPRIASFWTVKNGKIAAFQQHVDTLILAKAVGGPA